MSMTREDQNQYEDVLHRKIHVGARETVYRMNGGKMSKQGSVLYGACSDETFLVD